MRVAESEEGDSETSEDSSLHFMTQEEFEAQPSSLHYSPPGRLLALVERDRNLTRMAVLEGIHPEAQRMGAGRWSERRFGDLFAIITFKRESPAEGYIWFMNKT